MEINENLLGSWNYTCESALKNEQTGRNVKNYERQIIAVHCPC